MSYQIESFDVEKIIPYARNPRKNDHAVDQVAAAIKEFGFRVPMLVKSDGSLVDGHLRLKAAKKLGLETVPVVFCDDMTETQIKAFRLSVNRMAELADWDDDLLKLELEDLKFEDLFLDLIGFEDFDVEKEFLKDEDEIPEANEISIVKRGEIWILGNHRLMCGDSTSAEDVEFLMNGEKAEICFTSPPYNAGSLDISGQEGTKKKYNSFDDNQTEEQFEQFILSNLSLLIQYSADVFYNIGLVENNKRVIINVQHKLRDKFKDIIYWKKTTVAPHIQPGVINNLVEFILCFGDGRRKFKNAQFKQGSYWNVIEGSNASGNEFSKIHKATFPIYLPENIIENFCPKNGSVIDSFGGTGTTLIACEKTGRKCFMMELDEKYCDIIIKRWQDFTGRKAHRESDGKLFDQEQSN